MNKSKDIHYSTALKFIVILGIVALFSDLTYEGARSVTGPFLAQLGATGTIVGFVAGIGELIGYVLRFFSGFISDKTGRYWTVTITGYCINLFAVPLLALAGNWQMAAALIVLERIGKGIRTPARDALLSHAASVTGSGWGFGLHEALDQTGAVLGPLMIAAILYLGGSLRQGFVTLLIPALIAITVLITAWRLYPHPQELESSTVALDTKKLSRSFWFYLASMACLAAGFADFSLIAFHMAKIPTITKEWIPVLYSIAMGVDAIAALVFGRLFDRFGLKVLIIISLLSSMFAPLVFLGSFPYVIAGMCLWGISMGAQESIVRAAVAGMVSKERRGTAYGIFNTGYGIAWFAGSALMGLLYDVSIPVLVIFSIFIQLMSIPFLLKALVNSNISLKGKTS
jgi:MFS family permease